MTNEEVGAIEARWIKALKHDDPASVIESWRDVSMLLVEVKRLRALRSGAAIEAAAPDVTVNICITTKEPSDVAKSVLDALAAAVKLRHRDDQ